MRVFILTLYLLVAPQIYAAEESLPTRLLLSIEGFAGASYRVELIEGASSVRYLSNPRTFTGSDGTEEESIEVPQVRWLAFRKRLEEARVWDWKKRYENRRVADGTVWEVLIEWNGHKVDSSGSNAYPNAKRFSIYRVAVSELLGGRKFE